MISFIKNLFSNNQLGITFRKLKDFYMKDIERSIKRIKAATNIPTESTTKKRVIKNIEYNPTKKEYFISSIVNIPYKIKIVSFKDGTYKIKDRLENEAREIFSIIKLKTKAIVNFSKAQKEVNHFFKYLNEITLGEIIPVPISYKSEKISKILKSFKKIHHLKFTKTSRNNVKTITFKGIDLLTDKTVLGFISDSHYEISEVSGLFTLPSEQDLKFYVNIQGRVRLTINPEDLLLEDLNYLMRLCEEMEEYI